VRFVLTDDGVLLNDIVTILQAHLSDRDQRVEQHYAKVVSYA
jgi:hypothetical protein